MQLADWGVPHSCLDKNCEKQLGASHHSSGQTTRLMVLVPEK